MAGLVVTRGGADSLHEYMPSDYALYTFPADNRGIGPLSDIAVHVDKEDPLTKIVKLSPKTQEPELQFPWCHLLRCADLGLFA